MENKNKPTLFKDPYDGEYIGNIWGWKVSFIALAVIVSMILLLWYRYSQLSEEDLQKWEEQNKGKNENIIGANQGRELDVYAWDAGRVTGARGTGDA